MPQRATANLPPLLVYGVGRLRRGGQSRSRQLSCVYNQNLLVAVRSIVPKVEFDELFVKAIMLHSLFLVPPNQWENCH